MTDQELNRLIAQIGKRLVPAFILSLADEPPQHSEPKDAQGETNQSRGEQQAAAIEKPLRTDHTAEPAAPIATKSSFSGNQYITTAQLSKWLNIPRKTLENWRTAGRPNYGPPFTRIGQLVRYNVGQVRQWLDERCHASSTEN